MDEARQTSVRQKASKRGAFQRPSSNPAKDVICDWLDGAGLDYDVALASPFSGGIEWSSARPAAYTHVVFVCGPFGRSNVLQPFEDKVLIGIDLSMTEPVTEWNPFDWLFERDS